VHLEVLGALEMARAKNIEPPGSWTSYEEFRRWAEWVRAAERQTAAMHGFRVRR